jgi:predicted amidophosphoribosyltransferase
MSNRFQTAINLIFPPRCVGCGCLVEDDFRLCGSCWGQTPFIAGLVCDACGIPLPGQATGEAIYCDDCLSCPRPWLAGRSTLLYQDRARKIVLALKHGQRTEIARPAAQWMQQAGRPLFRSDMLIAPVPLHWSRLVRRTFNQSALLASALSQVTGLPTCPDLLVRTRRTVPLDKKTVEERFATLEGAITVSPRRWPLLASRPILLIDDVMTSGATLAAATHACHAAGSGDVFVLTLARVVKRP